MTQIRKRIVELVTKVTGAPELKKAETALRRIDKQTVIANKHLSVMSRSAAATGTAIGRMYNLIAGYAGIRSFGAIIRATVEQEQAVKQLNATLESTGGAVGRSSQELQDLASSLQRVTTFGDETIISAQSMLATFKEIRGVNFDRTLESVLDLSTKMDQDLKTSVVQLGKALNDPVKGLSALSRVGVSFTKEQTELIKSLSETGRVAEAQVIILQELESEFGGSARAAREGLGGALKSLKNAFGDLLESEDGAEDLARSANELSDIFTDPAFKASVQGVVDQILRLSGRGLTTMSNFTDIVGFLKDEFLALYGVVGQGDLVRLYERQADLQERLNRDGLSGLLQNTTELTKQLEQVNAQIAETERRLVDLSKLKPVTVTAQRIEGPRQSAGSDTVIDPDATRQLETRSQLFIDLRNNMKFLEEQEAAAEEATRKLTEAMEANSAELEYANGLYAKFNPEIATYQSSMFDLEEALRVGAISQERFNEEAKRLEETLVKSQEGWSLQTEAVQIFGDSFNTMLDGVLQGTQSLEDGVTAMVKVVLVQLAKLAAYQFIANSFAGTAFGDAAGSLLPSKKGNVFSKGSLVPFAQGGIVNGPTVFPLARGAGLMGEAGPEAILPLSRGKGGNLGVSAAPVNVVVNNNAPGVSVQAAQTDQGLTLDIVLEQVSNSIRVGGNSVSSAFEDSYSLNRGRGVY